MLLTLKVVISEFHQGLVKIPDTLCITILQFFFYLLRLKPDETTSLSKNILFRYAGLGFLLILELRSKQ